MNETDFKKLRNRVDTYKYSPLIFFSLFISPKLANGFYDTKRSNRLCSLHLRNKVNKNVIHIFFLPQDGYLRSNLLYKSKHERFLKADCFASFFATASLLIMTSCFYQLLWSDRDSRFRFIGSQTI